MFKKEYEEQLKAKILRKEMHQLAGKERKKNVIFYGLGMFGVFGWSIVIPTFLGLIIGYWLDEKWNLGFNWTLTFLFLGVVAGSINGWYWVTKERKSIEKDKKDD